jgi:hypothetical protein
MESAAPAQAWVKTRRERRAMFLARERRGQLRGSRGSEEEEEEGGEM